MRLLVIGMLGALVLAWGASLASANRSIEIRGGERGIFSSGRVTFAEPRLALNTAIICDITLLKTLARVIPKIRGTLIGKITGIAIDRGPVNESHCAFGANIVDVEEIVPLRDREAPGIHRELGNGVLLYNVSAAPARLWKLIYDSFQGTLPRIEGINYHIQGAQIRFDYEIIFGRLRCLYQGDWYKLIVIAAGVARILRIDLRNTILNRQSGGEFCLPQITASGDLTLTPTLTITLL